MSLSDATLVQYPVLTDEEAMTRDGRVVRADQQATAA